MDFSNRRKTGCLKKFCAYCCTFKRDLLKNNNFEKTIEITPRVIICKKLEKCGTYHQLITIRNTGTLCRRLKFITEPWSDVSYKINGNTELTSGADVTVSIYVEPIKKKLINKNRYFYVMAEHPDIVWEIPILVVGSSPEVFIPELICLPKVPANTISTYQFVIYNPLENNISFGLNTKYADLTISPISGNILAKDYCKILLNAKIPTQAMTASISATLSNGKSNSFIVRMEPSDQLIHLSTSILTFEDTYMGLRTQQNIHICNKSMESVNFRWSCCADPQDTTKSDADEELIISEFFRIRNKRGCIPPMNSALSIVTFCPPYDYNYNEEDEPPFKVTILIYLFCPMLGSKSYKLEINGNILGPHIEINPKDIDLGNIYMGQMQCLTFDVTNQGPIPGTIYSKDHTDQNEIRCVLVPLSMVLEPNSGGLFQLSFYRRDIGKFLTKLTFRSKFGNSLSVFLRGTCLAAKVKIWPELFEFGNIPICIPQKRYALVTNPLPVPIVVEPIVVDDGVEDPMILSVDYSKLPLHTRPASYYNLKCCKSRFEAGDDEELKPSYSDFGSDRRESDATSTNSQLSKMFQNKVLDDIPKMAEELLQNVKTLLPQFQPEPGMQIIDAALDCIFFRSDYFEDLKDKQNYLNMDWNALPCDAKEVAIEAERFFLKPGESKSFPVVLVPNSAGPCAKSIQFKACPMGIEHSELKTAIRSKYMVNTLHLQYKCAIPALECSDSVQFLTPLYVDMENGFHMKFRNIDVIPGFVYFKVIPKSAIGVMKVAESQRKFFIAPNDEIDVSCSVIFRKVGTITLRGMFQMIGKLMEYPFKLEAEVIPPKIQINPEKLTNKQQVLKMTRTRVFLENICPTVAQFSLSLKNDNYQFLEPLGGSLAPNQKILISIFSRYEDPGIYKNIIYVYLKHVGKISIPLTFIIEGAPLQFEPNIKLGLNFGNIFKTDESQNHLIKITNFGEKSYRLLFLKQKPKTMTLLPVSVFNIQPNGVTLAPKAEGSINISLDSSKEVCAQEEYSVDVMGEDNSRLKLCTFTTRCNVIKSKVVWNRNGIYLETGNPNESSNKICDTAIITNTTPLKANVVLNVIGCFVICDSLTGPMGKSLHFCLDGKAMKEFTIMLNEDEIEALDMCQCFKGFIKCKVNNKAQKPLLLHAKIVHPGVKICPPQVAFLAHNIASYSHINIYNCSPLRARFAWKQATIAHTKSPTQKNKELSYSKTISEIILNSAEGFVLNISEIEKLQESEISLIDEEFLDDDHSSISQGVSIKRKLAGNNSINPRNLSTSSRSESLESTIGKPSHYKSVAALSHKDEKQSCDINEIFDFLKLPRLMCTQSTELNRSRELDGGDRNYDEENILELEKIEPVVFQQRSGFILPKKMLKAYMFLPPVPEGDILITKFDLEVSGGRTESLEVTIASFNGRIRISTTEVDLGRQIWQKTTTGTIKLTNVCQYAVKISLIQSTDDGPYLTSGHVEIISPKVFIIMPEASASIEWKALLGLRYHFIEDIGVEINNNRTAIPIRFYGKGLMPMIAPVNLNKIKPSDLDNVKSFLAIHSVFRDFQVQKESQNQIDSSSIKDELTLNESKLSSSLTLNEEEIQSNINRKNRSRRNERNQHVMLNYSKETGPERMVVEQLIETWKLIDEINKSKELKRKFDRFYLNCLPDKTESEPVINLKLTICRPIPWELPVYVLNIGEINAGEIKTFEIDLIFLGPGKIFVSARTQTIIPGLAVWFEDFQRIGCPNSFVSFEQTPDDKTLTIYRNVRERAYSTPNQEAVVGLQHAHSYDLDEKNTHHRKNSSEKKKKIKEHYTLLSQPFKEKKNPLILAELFQITEAHLDHSTLKVVLRLEALSQFYDYDQLIEDYLLIDMHLGPTLPILLQGRVANNMTTKI